jgi:hypothetical protein
MGRVVMRFRYKGRSLVLFKDQYDKMLEFRKSRSLGNGEIDDNELQSWAESVTKGS